MTREEAIDILDDNFTVINTHGHYTDEETEQARQMAINALEQLTSYEQTINKLTEAISEQEPKTGHWTIKQYQVPIENKQIPTITGTVLSRESTACKIVYTYTHSVCKSEEYLNKYRFCPKCGAKMVEPEES